jgi:peptide/nickel transport system substrate-binding protein
MRKQERYHRRGALLLAAALLTAVLLGALAAAGQDAARATSPAASPSGGAGPATLRIGWDSEPDNLNPFLAVSSPSDYEVMQLQYDWLVGFDAATLQPRPALATSWSGSPDGKAWTFKLRPGVKWSDGQPFTAEDVAWTFNTIIRQGANVFSAPVQFIDKVVVVDPLTVEFRCSQPKADILRMNVPILPEHVWSKLSTKAMFTSFQNPAPVVGTGPFQVVKWVKGNDIQLKVNRYYWGPKPRVDQVVFSYYPNPQSMVWDLKSKNVSAIVDPPVAQFKALGANKGIQSIAANQDYLTQLYFNCDQSKQSQGNPVLRDPAFRRALNYAIDTQRIVSLAYGGLALPGTSLMPPGYGSVPWHWDPGAAAYTYDPAKATQLLAAAGYKNVGGVLLDKQGKPITLRLLTRAQSPAEQAAGKLIVGWFRAIGITVRLQVLDEGSLNAAIYATNGKGQLAPDFDMVIWWMGGNPDPGFLLSLETSDSIGYWGVTYWGNKAYDKLWLQQMTTIDQEARKQIIWKMQQLYYAESPAIVLAYPEVPQAYSTDWQGWVRSPSTGGVIDTAFNYDTYVGVRPAGDDATGSASRAWLAPVIIGGAVVVLALAFLLWRARRRHASESDQ